MPVATNSATRSPGCTPAASAAAVSSRSFPSSAKVRDTRSLVDQGRHAGCVRRAPGPFSAGSASRDEGSIPRGRHGRAGTAQGRRKSPQPAARPARVHPRTHSARRRRGCTAAFGNICCQRARNFGVKQKSLSPQMSFIGLSVQRPSAPCPKRSHDAWPAFIGMSSTKRRVAMRSCALP